MARRRGIASSAGAQKRAAGGDLRRRRLVLGGNATHGVDDRAIRQNQSVVGPTIIGPAGQAQFSERRIEQIAGVIAGERPSVRLAPFKPGASPMMTSRAPPSPNSRRGRWRSRDISRDLASRNAASLGHSAQSRGGLTSNAMPLRRDALLADRLFARGWRRRRLRVAVNMAAPDRGGRRRVRSDRVRFAASASRGR